MAKKPWNTYKACACYQCETEDACYARDWKNCKPCGTIGYEMDIRKPHGSNHYRRCKNILSVSDSHTMKQLWGFNRRALKQLYKDLINKQ